jgi:SAM-dependent methyltransferase
MSSISKKVNKVYSRENPSTYLRNYSRVLNFIKNREKLLLDLKLPPNIFKNSRLIDLGSGMGFNSLVYGRLGANCTLVEYDRHSALNSKKLFKKYSKNKFTLINKDIFKLKLNKKFDFVVSNGVAHHTKNPLLNLKICNNLLKKGGFLILGIGETNGFFQRNLQRYILYSLSENENEIIKLAKNLFSSHLLRSKKFSGRTINEIIFDTYINPKIETLSLNNIFNFLDKYKLEFYSYFGTLKTLDKFLNNDLEQFKLINFKNNKKYKKLNNYNINDIENFSLSNNSFSKKKPLKDLKQINTFLNNITSSINDQEFKVRKKNLNINLLKKLSVKIKQFRKVDVINKDHNLKFISELKYLIKIINSKIYKKSKIEKVQRYLKSCKVLLKGVNGVGMNYVVAYKK